MIAFLLQKLETTQEKVRMATLDILKHLINSCGVFVCVCRECVCECIECVCVFERVCLCVLDVCLCVLIL